MSYLPESWDPIAKVIGYDNEREMLEDLYGKQGLSYQQLADVLGYSRGNVRRRILSYGIEPAKRGGAQRVSSGKFKDVHDSRFDNPRQLAKDLNVSVAAVYMEKRKRKLTRYTKGDNVAILPDHARAGLGEVRPTEQDTHGSGTVPSTEQPVPPILRGEEDGR